MASVACGRCGNMMPLESNGDMAQQAELPGKGVTYVCLVCLNDLKIEAAQNGQELVQE